MTDFGGRNEPEVFPSENTVGVSACQQYVYDRPQSSSMRARPSCMLFELGEFSYRELILRAKVCLSLTPDIARCRHYDFTGCPNRCRRGAGSEPRY